MKSFWLKVALWMFGAVCLGAAACAAMYHYLFAPIGATGWWMVFIYFVIGWCLGKVYARVIPHPRRAL
jgi:hypothetical protein